MKGYPSTTGSSAKYVMFKHVKSIHKAKDIIVVHERGIQTLEENVLEICAIASITPSLLVGKQPTVIEAVWMQLAEAGKLKGIRDGRYSWDFSFGLSAIVKDKPWLSLSSHPKEELTT